MKSDWLVFTATVTILGVLAFETDFWRPQRDFLSFYRLSEKVAQTEQVSWIERIFYAAALSAKAEDAPGRYPEQHTCPRLILNPGPKI